MWTVKVRRQPTSTMRSITVEPAMFLQMAGDTLSYVIYQNLFIDKICLTELRFKKSICRAYENMEAADEEDQASMAPIIARIQQESAGFVLYNSLVENSLPVLLVLFLGVWSDATRRRKPPLLLSLLGKLCRSIGLLVNAWFMNWPVIILLFTAALPHSIGGANAVFNMAAFSYIADSSAPRHRTWRLGFAEAFWQLGSPIGLILGAYLYNRGGYLCVFSAAVLFHFVAVLYTIFLLPEIPQPKPPQYTVGKHGWYGTWHNSFKYSESLEGTIAPRRNRYYSENDKEEDSYGEVHKNNADSSLLVPSPTYRVYSDQDEVKASDASSTDFSIIDFIIGSVHSIFKWRPNHKRACLLCLGFIMLLLGLAHHGELNMKYLFTRNKFQWREQEFSNWAIFEGFMIVLGLVVVMPIFSKLLKFTDPFIGGIAALSRLVSRLFFALASNSKTLYIGSVFEIPGIMVGLSARSLASKCVLRDERGRIFAFLGCIDALVPLIAVPLYSLVYSNTLKTEPSAMYYLSCAIYTIIFIAFGSFFAAVKVGVVELTGTDASALTDPVIPPISGGNAPFVYRRTSLS